MLKNEWLDTSVVTSFCFDIYFAYTRKLKDVKMKKMQLLGNKKITKNICNTVVRIMILHQR